MTSAAELKRLIGQRKAITVPGTANALFARVIQDLGCPFPVLDTPQIQFSRSSMKPNNESDSGSAIPTDSPCHRRRSRRGAAALPHHRNRSIQVSHSTQEQGAETMTFATTKDGTQIFYKDWGPKSAQPIVFHHGWPLSSDDWDAQMLFFLAQGYRVVAHDRRGHGRSSQVSDGHDMDHYAADALAVAEHLNLKNAVHIGHSTGGGEVARYVAKYGQPQGRVAKAVLVSAVPPLMLKTERNPDGTPIEVFDGFREALAANRSQFFLDVASGPFYGFNRSGAKVSQGIVQNWWRQGMMGSAKAHYEGIKAFSETDQTEDLKAIAVPTLAMQGDDDQVVPYKDASLLQAKLLKNGTLKVYPGFPHGMCTTNADVINADLLAFIRS
ncbi:non-heme chloroperoxidase [Bradyrhizobium sp. AZCC 2289]